MIYASANRDEREWDQPDVFDVRRDATRQLGFGHGAHACAGQGLARMETQAMLRALVERVDRIELTGVTDVGDQQHHPATRTLAAQAHCRLSGPRYFSSDDDRPNSRRATTSCWICWVPSKMSMIFESRAHFSSRVSSE